MDYISTSVYRGEITDENHYATHDMEPEDWIGEVVTIPHPASGHMGSSMGIVTDAEPHTETKRWHTGEREGEEYEVDGAFVTVENVITGTEITLKTTASLGQDPSLVRDGSTYLVYGIQHKNGRDEWVSTTLGQGSGKWGHNPYMVESGMEYYEGHEEQRLVRKAAIYRRSPSADPSDSDAYTIETEITPIKINEDNDIIPTPDDQR